MVNTVIHRDRLERERHDAFEASQVYRVLLGIGSPLMVRVDAALGAEIVLRCHGVELIERQKISAFRDEQIVQGDRDDDGTAASAQGAIAVVWIDKALRQPRFELYTAAVTRTSMPWLDLDRCAHSTESP